MNPIHHESIRVNGANNGYVKKSWLKTFYSKQNPQKAQKDEKLVFQSNS